jgi:hypothetical protein
MRPEEVLIGCHPALYGVAERSEHTPALTHPATCSDDRSRGIDVTKPFGVNRPDFGEGAPYDDELPAAGRDTERSHDVDLRLVDGYCAHPVIAAGVGTIDHRLGARVEQGCDQELAASELARVCQVDVRQHPGPLPDANAVLESVSGEAASQHLVTANEVILCLQESG